MGVLGVCTARSAHAWWASWASAALSDPVRRHETLFYLLSTEHRAFHICLVTINTLPGAQACLLCSPHTWPSVRGPLEHAGERSATSRPGDIAGQQTQDNTHQEGLEQDTWAQNPCPGWCASSAHVTLSHREVSPQLTDTLGKEWRRLPPIGHIAVLAASLVIQR